MASRFDNLFKGLGRSWFGLAMLGLLVLAIPGLILFGLNLFGGQEDFNSFLESKFHLSYHIPVGWLIALILFLVPVAILLLYFLKLKRKPLSVPSTFLWRK